MERYKVLIYPSAKRDLLEIIDYLNTLSHDAAVRYYDLLVQQINSLCTMPESCPKPKDLTLAAKGYRFMVIEKYLVFYVIDRDTVQIRRILYGRREYGSFL